MYAGVEGWGKVRGGGVFRLEYLTTDITEATLTGLPGSPGVSKNPVEDQWPPYAPHGVISSWSTTKHA